MKLESFEKHLILLEEQIHADSLMVWLWDEESGNLVASYCPAFPEMVGYKQKLASGVMSQVFLTGLPILENGLKEHPLHDPSFDKNSGQDCRALMAALIHGEQEPMGLLTAALFSNSGTKWDFGDAQLKTLAETAKELGSSRAS